MKEKKCAWCGDEGTLYDSDGEMICYGCVSSEINRLRKLIESEGDVIA
jgi:hypothetical protein